MRKLLVIAALVAILALMLVQFGPGILFRGEAAHSILAR
jgi:hypothetical protein